MIKLTGTNGEAEVFSPEHIIRVKDDVCTKVYLFGGGYVVVNEPYEEVVRKIMEYKLVMTRYKALASAWATEEANNKHGTDTLRTIHNLAGLEQTP